MGAGEEAICCLWCVEEEYVSPDCPLWNGRAGNWGESLGNPHAEEPFMGGDRKRGLIGRVFCGKEENKRRRARFGGGGSGGVDQDLDLGTSFICWPCLCICICLCMKWWDCRVGVLEFRYGVSTTSTESESMCLRCPQASPKRSFSPISSFCRYQGPAPLR